MNVNKNINYLSLKTWLLTIYVLVSLIVFVGGFTRLTESGLSITVWEVFKGILPPLNIDEWNVYFDQYKQIPEYKALNSGMALNEFKTIFYWEYGHRLMARLIGLICIIPLLYFTFIYKDFFQKFKKYYLLFFLILIQGIIGWYMVKSGLDKNLDVSHFRLSIHLSIALIILSLSFWFFLELSNIKKYSFKIPEKLINLILIFLVIQIILGAFLAGLNGGLIYNTWPDMSGSFFPNDSIFIDYPISRLPILSWLALTSSKDGNIEKTKSYVKEFETLISIDDPEVKEIISLNWNMYRVYQSLGNTNSAKECLENSYLEIKTHSKKIKDKKDRNKYLSAKLNQDITAAWNN